MDKNYHDTRFKFDEKRDILWRTIYNCFFKSQIKSNYALLELGAGYCNFINQAECTTRIAIDVWSGFTRYAADGVITKVCKINEINFIENNSLDFVFASNIFEHVTQDELIETLRILKYKLKKNASINIIQPNFKYAYREYFDDYTHKAVYTHISLSDLLEAHGYKVISNKGKFLPLSIKSIFPVHPLLIKFYMSLPVKPFAKQMFIKAIKV